MRFKITPHDPTTHRKRDPLWLNLRYTELVEIAKAVNLFAALRIPERHFKVGIMHVVDSKKTSYTLAPIVITEIEVRTFIRPGSEHDVTVLAHPSRIYTFSQYGQPSVKDDEIMCGKKEFSSDREALDDLAAHIHEGMERIGLDIADKLAALDDLRKVIQRKT